MGFRLHFSWLIVLLSLFLFIGCTEKDVLKVNPKPRFEKITYYKILDHDSLIPYKSRVDYYLNNGLPYRWLEMDSLGMIQTDYLIEYDKNWIQTGAKYREEGDPEFSIERVIFQNDSTKTTEWLDSIGNVYYKMIDNLNSDGKTYRASFIGDKLHGYDSTFYNKNGFISRIFFTNVKGKVYNDRRFTYDSINENGHWVQRKKIMKDEIVDIQKREVYYDDYFTTKDNIFYPGIISTEETDENVISFSKDESLMLFTRTKNWKDQKAYLSRKENGVFNLAKTIPKLDSIYNAAISPSGNQIIYSKKENNTSTIGLIRKTNGEWGNNLKLTVPSNLETGYFSWLNEDEVFFYQQVNRGDIFHGKIEGTELKILDSLAILNTDDCTEFSPYIDPQKRFIIFTRYQDKNKINQGFFISYNELNGDNVEWSKPKRIEQLPYGWSANIINNNTQFIFTNGENIYSYPIFELNLLTRDE